MSWECNVLRRYVKILLSKNASVVLNKFAAAPTFTNPT